MAVPSSNDAFSLDEVKFSEPVKPHVAQATRTCCCLTRRKCIILTVLIGTAAAGLVVGLPHAMALRGSRGLPREPPRDGPPTGDDNGNARIVDLTMDIPAFTPQQQAVVDAARALTQLLASSANLADAMGGIVRLAFHDAGTFDGSIGGADGCVDLEGIENRGLAPVITMLEPVVAAAAGNLSRADVWVLAANVAIEFAGGPQLDFEAGRTDAASCAGHSIRLPDAQQGHLHVQDVFVSRLGFTEREVVALMGAHVLGRAEAANSGYSGAWVPRNDRFTNDYFQDLLQVPWNRREQPAFEGARRTQWDGRGNTMMLNTDIELAFDTSRGCSRAGGNGGRNSCPRAGHGFSAAVSEFAGQGQPAFFQAFGPAWKKLAALRAGPVALRCPFSDCSTPGPFVAVGGQMGQRQPRRSRR